MSALNVQSLLAAVSAESPGGENLEYDPDYMEMMRLSLGTPERVMGESIVPGEEPNWRDVRERCVALFKRTKDLAVAIKLCEAMLRLEGLTGLKDSIAVISGLVSQYWDQLHPQLDPSDGNDPTMRMNILATLTDSTQLLQKLQTVPLANSTTAGRFGLRDIAWATGKAVPPEGTTVPKADVVKAAFKDTPPAELVASAQAASEAIALIKATDAAVTAKVGVGRGVNFDAILKVLKDAGNELRPYLPSGTPGADGGSDQPAGDGATGQASASRSGTNGDIASHKDVIAAIDRICDYFEQFEPSSPIPLLLRRAQRLVGKKFLDIVKDLSPDVVAQIMALGGIVEEAPAST